MSQRTFSLTAGIVFALVALGHLLRILFEVEWVVEGRIIAMWASWVALVVAGFLAYQGFRLGTQKQ